MNEYTEEKLAAFMNLLKHYKVPKETIFGICSFLETEEIMQEMVNRLLEKGLEASPEEAEQICLRVIAENLK